MKTTLDLPDELVRAVKLRAVSQGRPLKDLVAEYLNQGLGLPPVTKHEKGSSLVLTSDQGLPVVRCRPSAAAKRLSGKRMLAYEQKFQRDEDLKRAGLPLRYHRLGGVGLYDASTASSFASSAWGRN